METLKNTTWILVMIVMVAIVDFILVSMFWSIEGGVVMREIKFRAWGISNEHPDGKMYYPGELPIVINLFGNPIHAPGGTPIDRCCYMRVGWNDVDLMQFTGLKDKNGVDIYDGDILNQHPGFGCEWKKRIGVVEHRGASFWFNFRKQSFVLDYHDCDFEVIGNIHENPELLEE